MVTCSLIVGKYTLQRSNIRNSIYIYIYNLTDGFRSWFSAVISRVMIGLMKGKQFKIHRNLFENVLTSIRRCRDGNVSSATITPKKSFRRNNRGAGNDVNCVCSLGCAFQREENPISRFRTAAEERKLTLS